MADYLGKNTWARARRWRDGGWHGGKKPRESSRKRRAAPRSDSWRERKEFVWQSWNEKEGGQTNDLSSRGGGGGNHARVSLAKEKKS